MSNKNRVALALTLVFAAAFSAADASAVPIADPFQCAGNHESGIVCVGDGSSGSDYGASDFLGAFASDKEEGGWVEFYEDKQGEWWVEHHNDGSTTVGWDESDGGGGGKKHKHFSGPKMGGGEGEATRRIKTTGAMSVGTLAHSFASTKAAASVKTGSFSSMTTPKSFFVVDGRAAMQPLTIPLTIPGSGSCHASLVVSHNGKILSSTGVVTVGFPLSRQVSVPATPGAYKIELSGKDGCVGAKTHIGVVVTNGGINVAPRK